MPNKKKESQLALIVVNPKRDRSRKTMSGEVLFPSQERLMAERAEACIYRQECHNLLE